MLVSREKLMVLLNAIYYSGEKIVDITYPPIGEIFSIDLDENNVDVIEKTEYQERLDSFKENLDETFLKEIPDSSVIKDCLRMSGIIKPTNLSDIESELTELGKIDLMKGDKPLFLGFDNNALQNRDNIFIAKIIKEKNLKIRFCLSHIVYDELHKNFDRSLDYEINPPQSLSFMNRFGNQIPFRYRKARIGAVEYKILSNHEYLYEIRNNATGENYDQKIINSYDTLNKNNNLVLVSGDHNFIDFAQSKNIRTIQPRFEYSYSSSYKVSWENFCDLIYVSAILFGYIEVNDDSIYGIWNGKNTDNWNNENLNIYSNYEKFSKFYKIVN